MTNDLLDGHEYRLLRNHRLLVGKEWSDLSRLLVLGNHGDDPGYAGSHYTALQRSIIGEER